MQKTKYEMNCGNEMNRVMTETKEMTNELIGKAFDFEDLKNINPEEFMMLQRAFKLLDDSIKLSIKMVQELDETYNKVCDLQDEINKLNEKLNKKENK